MKSLEALNSVVHGGKEVTRYVAPWVLNIAPLMGVYGIADGSVDIQTGVGIGLASSIAGGYLYFRNLRKQEVRDKDFLLIGLKLAWGAITDVPQESSVRQARDLVVKGEVLASEVASYSAQIVQDTEKASIHRGRLMQIYEAAGRALDMLRPAQGSTRGSAGRTREPFSGPKYN